MACKTMLPFLCSWNLLLSARGDLDAVLGADSECASDETCALKMLQTRGVQRATESFSDKINAQSDRKERFNFAKPNPDLLRWDTVFRLTNNYTMLFGWLKVPLNHNSEEVALEGTPSVCLRVRGWTLTQEYGGVPESEKLGLMFTHCGGPGSGRGCSIGFSTPTDKYYDFLTIQQRGIEPTGDEKSQLEALDDSIPDCPFQSESGEAALLYPTAKCAELMNIDNSHHLAKLLGLSVDSREMDDIVLPIMLAGQGGLGVGGASNDLTGLAFRNESFVRWYYRMMSLEYQRCYKNPTSYLKYKKTGRKYNIFEYMGTVTLANDIEVFRSAFGNRKLSCWGISYGTAVCGTYATIYPDNIFRMILDGNVDPKPTVEEYANEAAWGPEAVLSGITAACENSYASDLPADKTCPLAPMMSQKVTAMIYGQDKERANAAVGILDKFSAQSDVTCSAVMVACLNNAFREIDDDSVCPWKFNLSAPKHADFKVLRFRDLDAQSAAATSGKTTTTTTVKVDWFGLAAINAVVGLDIAGRFTEEALISWWRKAKVKYPAGLNRGLQYAIGLGAWPVQPKPMPPLGDPSLRPLIVGNLHDLQTSYKASQAMRQSFPGAFVTFQGYGHGLTHESNEEALEIARNQGASGKAYTRTNAVQRALCASVAYKYLIQGTLPPDGFSCDSPRDAMVSLEEAKSTLGQCAEQE